MEQYDLAADRHFTTAEFLNAGGHVCDAGYHYGLSGENALKHSLRASGVEAFWLSVGRDRFQTAMQGHFTGLTSKVDQLRAEILANATGRLAAPIVSVVLAPAFLSMFSGWSIMIRYADTGFTPVQQVDCDRWKVDATDLMLNLVVV